ncbi:MAG: Tim44/TimA family putative adaptor protein [Alphaproteobacteria bacterium]
MEGFGYGDIIVIGAIAAFIILRYRAMLGEQSGRDPASIKPAPVTETMEPVIRVSEREKPLVVPSESATSYAPALASQFKAMQAIDSQFTPEDFLQGARMAFEMVIKAFSEHDRDTLKMLLSPAIFSNFDAAMRDQESRQVRQETTLVAVTESNITSADLRGKIAELTVAITSEQIHLQRDAAGKITGGDASRVETVADEWVFTRDLTSTSPNWLVSET